MTEGMTGSIPNTGGCCEYAGQGRGDCEHAIGLPGKSIPGRHDGPDDTVDEYGKPNWWCWQCWKSHQIQQLQDVNTDLLAALKKLANAEKEYRYLHDHMGGDRPETGRAWDLMRRAGDDARTVIEAAEGKP